MITLASAGFPQWLQADEIIKPAGLPVEIDLEALLLETSKSPNDSLKQSRPIQRPRPVNSRSKLRQYQGIPEIGEHDLLSIVNSSTSLFLARDRSSPARTFFLFFTAALHESRWNL
jgi:hypothetical protein